MTCRRRLRYFVLAVAFVRPASAQNPTLSLIPLTDSVRRECAGGPNVGQPCTSAADCEIGPKCQRIPSDAGESCVTSVGCPQATCLQTCSCNYVVEAAPGDEITADVMLAGSVPNGQKLAGWEVNFDLTSGRPYLLSVGVDLPQREIRCSSDQECPEAFPYCAFTNAICYGECQEPCPRSMCIGPDHCALDGVFSETSRPDYVFHSLAQLGPVFDVSTVDYRGSAVLFSANDAVEFVDPRYLLTIRLRVLPDAEGSAVVLLQSRVRRTRSRLINEGSQYIECLETEGLTVEFVEVPDLSEPDMVRTPQPFKDGRGTR